MKRLIVAGSLAVLGVVGWYLFRPELLFINRTVDESLALAATDSGSAMPAAADPVSSPAVLATGRFHSNAHETIGTATVHTVGTERVLRFTDFVTSNGPDLRVYLVAADDVNDDGIVKSAGFVELGPLKGNRGNQNYAIPDTIDLATFRTVTIWCRRFSVNFGSAPLMRG